MCRCASVISCGWVRLQQRVSETGGDAGGVSFFSFGNEAAPLPVGEWAVFYFGSISQILVLLYIQQFYAQLYLYRLEYYYYLIPLLLIPE